MTQPLWASARSVDHCGRSRPPRIRRSTGDFIHCVEHVMPDVAWHEGCENLSGRRAVVPPARREWAPWKGHRMNPRHYVDLKETSRNLQPTYYFMINCLLYSRMETGLVSNQDFYDEDVNVYLAHLLHSFINPEYVEQSKKFLSKYDTDVFRRLANSSDARLKYLIYKTNADFLLVSIGIFDNPMAEAAHRAKLQP